MMQTVRATTFADIDQAVASLAAAKSRKTDPANLFDLRQVIACGVPVRLVDQDGATVGGYVVQPFGADLWITAAAGRAGGALCPVIDQHAADQARRGGYQAVMFRTVRPGLAKRCAALGYNLVRKQAGVYYMRKNIQ